MMKRTGSTAGDDFGDNRVPGKGQNKRFRKSLTTVPELDNQRAVIKLIETASRGFRLGARGAAMCAHRKAGATTLDAPREAAASVASAHPRSASGNLTDAKASLAAPDLTRE